MPVPTVAIIGRANVGKSTLFNKLIRKKSSIVNDTPGVTRDRLYAPADWLGKPAMVIDTGGIDLDGENEIEIRVKEQGEFARTEADVVIFVVDKQRGLIPQDREIIDHLRKAGKPLFLAVNKVDHLGHEDDVVDFMELGMDRLYAISAEHGHGLYELMEAVATALPESEESEDAGDVIRIAFIGKPNVGKSSLVNRLLESDRCIVTNIPGTTRDAVDTELVYNEQKIILVDTAGLRRKGKTKQLLDKFSGVRQICKHIYSSF